MTLVPPSVLVPLVLNPLVAIPGVSIEAFVPVFGKFYLTSSDLRKYIPTHILELLYFKTLCGILGLH